MYQVEQCVVAEPTSIEPIPESALAGKWRAISNPVEGLGHELGSLHTCSWVVTDLPHAEWVTFRVRVSNCSAYAEWSMPSQARAPKRQRLVAALAARTLPCLGSLPAALPCLGLLLLRPCPAIPAPPLSAPHSPRVRIYV